MPKLTARDYARAARAAGRRITSAQLTDDVHTYWAEAAVEAGVPLPILLGDILADAVFKITIIKPFKKPTPDFGAAVVEAIRSYHVPGQNHANRLGMAEIARRIVELSSEDRGPTIAEIAEKDRTHQTTTRRHATFLIDTGAVRLVRKQGRGSKPVDTLVFSDDPTGAIRKAAAAPQLELA